MTTQFEPSGDEIDLAVFSICPNDTFCAKFEERWFHMSIEFRRASLNAWINMLQEIRERTDYEAELMK